MDVTLPLWLVILGGLLIVLLGVMIWSSRRTLSGNISAVRLEKLADLLPNLASLTGEPVCDGNEVQVIQDAAFFDALLDDLAAAESSIHYETYVWWKGDICNRFSKMLAEKAKQGVEVEERPPS
jgi:cardiolipin synthase